MNKKPMNKKNIEVIILAAGLGTRMKSTLPKVLHPICDKPIIEHLLYALDGLKNSEYKLTKFNIVVGHGRDQVKAVVDALTQNKKIKTPVVYSAQEKQLGTGHAVKLAIEQNAPRSETIGVFNGDLPLFTSQAFEEFLKSHFECKSTATLGSTVLRDPGQYGRVLRQKDIFIKVVEAKDASGKELQVNEINGGVYLFDSKFLQGSIKNIKSGNKAGEFYLPDLFEQGKKLKKKIHAHCFKDAQLMSGVNTLKELMMAEAALFVRFADKLLENGVKVLDPFHTRIDDEVSIGTGSVIGPFTRISGCSKIGENVKIAAHCELHDVEIGAGSEIRHSTVAYKSIIGKNCAVGPMAHMRPGTKLSDDVRVGNFVEIKESSIGSHTNAAHLSYIGDAEIGSNVNLGCGFITCNYDGQIRDGRRKHQTKIGNDVFVGSDAQLVAPIEIADGTFIASGSTVTESVKQKDSLVIARTRQITKSGYAKKYKK